jgi:hypothetical protein
MSEETAVVDDAQNQRNEESAPVPPPTPEYSFQPPPGYILLPEQVYQLLVKSAEQHRPPLTEDRPTRAAKKSDRTVYLRVRRPIHLGDIKTQINPGEVVEFIPHKSVTIRGKVSNELGSFLGCFNKQWPGSPSYDPRYDPVFDIDDESMIYLETILGGSQFRGPRPRTERQRIEEEERYSATRYRTDAGIEGARFSTTPQPTARQYNEVEFGDDYDELPPRGSQARKELIHNMSIEQLNAPGRRGTGMENYDVGNVASIPTTGYASDQRTVARVPGRPADDGNARPARMRRR